MLRSTGPTTGTPQTSRAAAAAATRAKVQGNLGGRAKSLRTVWYAEIKDPVMAIAYYRGHPKVIELITSLATAEVRAKDGPRDIQGFHCFSRQE